MAFNVAKIASGRASLTISLTKSLRVAGPFDPENGRVFSGVRKSLGMTFNYLILWVNVLGSVNSNHNHNPKHIYNPNPNLTLILTLTLNLP